MWAVIRVLHVDDDPDFADLTSTYPLESIEDPLDESDFEARTRRGLAAAALPRGTTGPGRRGSRAARAQSVRRTSWNIGCRKAPTLKPSTSGRRAKIHSQPGV